MDIASVVRSVRKFVLYCGEKVGIHGKTAYSGRRNYRPAAQWKLAFTSQPKRAALIPYLQKSAICPGMDPQDPGSDRPGFNL